MLVSLQVFLGELDQRKEVVEQLAEQTKPNEPLGQLSDAEKEAFRDLTDPLLDRVYIDFFVFLFFSSNHIRSTIFFCFTDPDNAI